MKKRPNPILHMMAWGVGSGLILAMSYIVILFDVFNDGFNINPLLMLISPFSWYLAFIFGVIPGALMGFFVGLNLWRTMRHVDLPFTKMDMQQKRLGVYGTTFLITLIMSYLLLAIFFGGLLDFLLMFLPPFIAAIASTYAAHRYMFRMRVWSGGIEGRKSKAKNDAQAVSRLADKETESRGTYHEANTQSQSDYHS